MPDKQLCYNQIEIDDDGSSISIDTTLDYSGDYIWVELSTTIGNHPKSVCFSFELEESKAQKILKKMIGVLQETIKQLPSYEPEKLSTEEGLRALGGEDIVKISNPLQGIQLLMKDKYGKKKDVLENPEYIYE